MPGDAPSSARKTRQPTSRIPRRALNVTATPTRLSKFAAARLAKISPCCRPRRRIVPLGRTHHLCVRAGRQRAAPAEILWRGGHPDAARLKRAGQQAFGFVGGVLADINEIAPKGSILA